MTWDEESTIDPAVLPNTVDSLAADLGRLGLEPGMTVLVHTSLSSLGWVCGGAAAVVLTLEQVLTPRGTLVMPTHSGDLSDPGSWAHPPVPELWWPVIRRTMPVFDATLTPTRGMGAVAEAFRHQKGVVRSHHPVVSFAAWGRHRHRVTRRHPWDHPLGPGGPLGRLRALGGSILLLGVGHERNTTLHLAETLAVWPGRTEVEEPVPWARWKDRTVWRPMWSVAYQGGDFEALGAAFEAAVPGAVHRGTIGSAPARLVAVDPLIRFAVDWMGEHRR